MLQRIQNVESKDAYLKMTRDGDTILDILPGGVLRRTPVIPEMFAQGRYVQADRSGEAMAHLLASFVTGLEMSNKAFCCSTDAYIHPPGLHLLASSEVNHHLPRLRSSSPLILNA